MEHKSAAAAKKKTWRRWAKRAGQVVALGLLNGMATATGKLVVAGVMMWAGQW